MAELTIRNGGTVVSRHLLRGKGIEGSVGIHVLPGLEMVVIDGMTIRNFDVCILAESPVVIVDCEILRWRSAGVIVKGAQAWVSFCSFLDQAEGFGAAIVARRCSPSVRGNVFQIEGARRWFGVGDPRRAAWDVRDNVGVAENVFGSSAGDSEGFSIAALEQRLAVIEIDGIIAESPGFASVKDGSENLRLLTSSRAVMLVSDAGLPEHQHFDTATHLPKADRRSIRRPVTLLTAGANEASFSMTSSGKVRILELISGLSSVPFDRVGSGRGGVFRRAPRTIPNPSDEATEDPLDIQPADEIAIVSSDSEVGSSSLAIRPERLGIVHRQVMALPGGRSSLSGIRGLSVYGWVRPKSDGADIIIHKHGSGRAQGRPVLEASFLFGGEVSPTLSLKLGEAGSPGIDVSFVSDSAALVSLIRGWALNEKWCFFAWSWDGALPSFLIASEDDSHLRGFSSRTFMLDLVSEQMVPAAMAFFPPSIDPNTEPVYVGSDPEGGRGWDGNIGEISIDIGAALSRADLEAIFASKASLPGKSRFTRSIPQRDVIFALADGLFAKPPQAFAGSVSTDGESFSEVLKVVGSGTALYVAARKPGAERWGIFKVEDGLSAVIENVDGLRDFDVDRNGHLVLVAEDFLLSRIDPDEGIRREIAAGLSGPTAVAATLDNDYVVADGGSLTVVTPPPDIASEGPESVLFPDIGIALGDVSQIAVAEDGGIYILEPSPPRIVLVQIATVFDQVFQFGVGQDIAASATLASDSFDFGSSGIAAGDVLRFESDPAKLVSGAAEAVAAVDDPTLPDNSLPRVVRSASADSIELDKPMAAEVPSSGKTFEMRVIRKSVSSRLVKSGSPLIAPTAIASNPGDSSNPILVADPEAAKSETDPAKGVVFALSASGMTVKYSLSNIGLDLSTISALGVREDASLPPTQAAASLRSRLTWAMVPDASGRIPNSALPGESDLVVPTASLEELIVSKRAKVSVRREADAAVLRYAASFGPGPELEPLYVNDEYENLGELGIMTRDGVLLGRHTLARMPYDPLGEVRTDWAQEIRVS